MDNRLCDQIRLLLNHLPSWIEDETKTEILYLYSEVDKGLVLPLLNWLRCDGYSLGSTSIARGEQLSSVLLQRIEQARLTVAFMSNDLIIALQHADQRFLQLLQAYQKTLFVHLRPCVGWTEEALLVPRCAFTQWSDPVAAIHEIEDALQRALAPNSNELQDRKLPRTRIILQFLQPPSSREDEQQYLDYLAASFPFDADDPQEQIFLEEQRVVLFVNQFSLAQCEWICKHWQGNMFSLVEVCYLRRS